MKLPSNCLHYAERVGICRHPTNHNKPCKGIKTCEYFKKWK